MPEIRLVKKYPHIKDEDVTRIFQDGYMKGWENARKKAIPIEWIKEWYKKALSKSGFMGDEMVSVEDLLEDWEKENGTEESVRNTGI